MEILKTFLLLILVMWSLPSEAQQPPASRIRIGVSLPLSGPTSTYGQDIQRVLKFAVAKLGSDRYELVFEDDKCLPRDAATIAQKFVSTDRVQYVLGFACSGSMLAAAPIYDRAGLLVVAALPSADAVSRAGQYIFRTRPSDIGAARLVADEVSKTYRTFGILSEQTDYAQAVKADVIRLIDANRVGLHVDDFMTDETDLKPTLLRLKSKGIEGLLVLSQSEQSALQVLQQIRALGLSFPVYGSNAMNSKTFLELAGPQAEGVRIVSLPDNESVLTAEGKALYSEFIEMHGPLRSVEYSFYCAFESVRALISAIESGRDPKEFLYKTEFQGVVGPYRFDSNGDIVGVSPVIKVVKGGKLVETR